MARDIIGEARRFSLSDSYAHEEQDSLLDDAIKLVVQYDKASASLIQRRLSMGYARAARILDQLEAAGVIGSGNGAIPRDVLVSSYEDYQKGKFKQSSQPADETEPEPDYSNFSLPQWKKLLKSDSSFRRCLSKMTETGNPNPFSFPVGWDKNELTVESLITSPHTIITGSPTSNTLAYLDTLLTSLLCFETPNTFRLLLLDGARYLHLYNGIPHILTPVTGEADKVLSALRWGIGEMEHRFQEFQKTECRDITSYNKTSTTPICHILFVVTRVDEYFSYATKEITDAVKRLTSLGARAGIHIILTVDSLTSRTIPNEIQENIPTVISFKNTRVGTAKTIDTEALHPDELLYKNDRENILQKLQAPLITEEEVRIIVKELQNSLAAK